MREEPVESTFSTQVSLHGIRNIFGEPTQLSLSGDNDINHIQKIFSTRLEQIKSVGSELTQMQFRVLEAILHGFTLSGYKGNRPAVRREEILAAKEDGDFTPIFQYVKELPVLRVRQAEFLNWAEINRNQISTTTGALLALKDLSQKMFYYYYERTAQDEEGNLIKDGKGWKKEQVSCVGTLFVLEEIRQGDLVLYYDIRLNPIFLDQLGSYFLMIPDNWRREVKAHLGKRKISTYVFIFLMFLRYQYELRRRSQKTLPPYKLERHPEDIAIAINMPTSIYKKNRKRMNKILDECYATAQSLGYLQSYKRLGVLDILVFDEKKYYNPKTLLQERGGPTEEEINHKEALALFKFFYSCRKMLDQGLVEPVGAARNRHIKAFIELLKERKGAEIERLIRWSVNAKFWSSRLSSPLMLSREFHKAWMEMLSSRSNREKNEDTLKKYGQECLEKGFELRYQISQDVSLGSVLVRMELILADRGKHSLPFFDANLNSISRDPVVFEQDVQEAISKGEVCFAEMERECKRVEEDLRSREEFRKSVEKGRSLFAPVEGFLRKAGHTLKWGINGDLVVNGKTTSAFANKVSFLDDLCVFFESEKLLDGELEALLESLKQEATCV